MRFGSAPVLVERFEVAASAPTAGKRVTAPERRAGIGAQAAVDRFVSAVSPRNDGPGARYSLTEESRVKRVWAIGSDWRISVSDDGNSLRYRRDRPVDTRRLTLAEKPSRDGVLSSGLHVVTNQLADIVRLGPGEALVSLDVRYEYARTITVDGSKPDLVEVAGWEAVFGRAVSGTLVIGGGSHVAVGFDASGKLESVDLDWPEYEPTDYMMELASESDVRARGTAQEEPLLHNEEQTEVGLECGYFDPGGRHTRTTAQIVQPGCVRKLFSEQPGPPEASEPFRWATSQAIPAAVEPIDDPAWTGHAGQVPDIPEH